MPENAFNQTVLEKLLDAGALGLKVIERTPIRSFESLRIFF